MTSGTVTRGWRARLYPSKAQAASVDLWANHARGLWNRLLDAVVRRHQEDGRFLWRADLQRLVVGWKRRSDTAWVGELPAHAALDVCARLDGALRRMVAERKAGRRCGFPRFRKKRWGEGSVYFVNQATRLASDGRSVRLPRLGVVRLRGGAPPAGRLLGSRARRDGDRWLLAAQFETPRPEPLPPTGIRLGVDVGLTQIVTVFDGVACERVHAPRPLRRALKRLRRAQRRMSKRRKASGRRHAQVGRVAALHRKVRQRRADFLHQLSHRLTSKAEGLVIETLDLRAMARALRLGRSVADAALGALLRFVRYKADWRGREVVSADRWYPSTKLCCRCGSRHEMPLSRRWLSCACGSEIGRDENAAVNLYWYPEEPGNRAREGATRGEIGCQAAGSVPPPVPVVEPRMPAGVAT